MKKEGIKKEYGLVSNEEIVTSSLKRIKRLEQIHEQRNQITTKKDQMAFWILIAITVFSNFLLSLILIFLILILEHPFLYVIAIVLGLAFGMIYERLINGMTHLDTHHHVFSLLVILVGGVINIIYILGITSVLFDFFGMKNRIYSHFTMALTYLIAYLLPYIVYRIVKLIKG